MTVEIATKKNGTPQTRGSFLCVVKLRNKDESILPVKVVVFLNAPNVR